MITLVVHIVVLDHGHVSERRKVFAPLRWQTFNGSHVQLPQRSDSTSNGLKQCAIHGGS